MAAIWENDGGGWRVAAPSALEAEAQPHDLVDETPGLLPPAGGLAVPQVSLEDTSLELLNARPVNYMSGMCR